MQYVFLTIILTVYGQLVMKWQVILLGSISGTAITKITYLVNLLSNLWVLSSFLAAFAASLSWMLAMNKLQLSYAYPFVSLAFVFVLLFSAVLFYEPITWPKIVGVIFIILGVGVSSFG